LVTVYSNLDLCRLVNRVSFGLKVVREHCRHVGSGKLSATRSPFFFLSLEGHMEIEIISSFIYLPFFFNKVDEFPIVIFANVSMLK